MKIEELKERISELPWKVDGTGKEYTLLCNTYLESPMDAIANTAFCYADQHRENMTFAAHAANNFFPLLEALELALPNIDRKERGAVAFLVEAAIKQAKEVK